MTSPLIFNIESILPASIGITDERGNDIREYHSLILSSYYGKPITKYDHSVEDMICYCIGDILSKIEITDYDALSNKISFINDYSYTDWEINFLFSIVTRHILNGKKITSRQFECLKKMKFSIPEQYKVEVIEDNLKNNLKQTFVKPKEVKFLYSNIVGIRFEFDVEIIVFLTNLFGKRISYNRNLELNIIEITQLTEEKLKKLESIGFEVDQLIYDLLYLNQSDFFEVVENENLVVLDNGGFTTSLIKTLLLSGNIT